jgi:AcrR family transcriptional regulator
MNVNTTLDSPGAVRRAELLEAAIDYAAEHGLSRMSVRPVADALGISHRTLLYYFGSKEQLIADLLLGLRRRERARFQETADTASTLRAIWERWAELAAGPLAPVIGLSLEAGAYALRDRARYHELLVSGVEDWVELVAALMTRDGLAAERARTMATAVVGAFRGLQLDLLFTRDRKRIDAAAESLIALVSAARSDSPRDS